MPKDYDFEGADKGWEFERKGYQERNINNLVSILSNKEATTTLTAMAKMEKETWQNIRFTVADLKTLTSGSNIDILGGIGDSLKETISIELERVIAPLKNEIIAGINLALEPLMPAISVIVNNAASAIALGFQGWVSVFTGRWDDFERRLEELFPGVTDLRDELRVGLTEYWQRLLMSLDPLYREQILDANAAGTAGGVYSGQFDIDPDTLAGMLEGLEIPDFSEE